LIKYIQPAFQRLRNYIIKAYSMSKRIYKIQKKNFKTRKQIVYRGGGEGEPAGESEPAGAGAPEPSAPPKPVEEEPAGAGEPSEPAEEEPDAGKEEGQGGEEESPEVEVKEPTGFIKPMAYLALGIVESGSALAVRMMAKILKIDITGKDAGKLLKEFNISLEKKETREEFARFLANVADKSSVAVDALTPPVLHLTDKLLDVANELGDKAVVTAAKVATTAITSVPFVGSAMGVLFNIDNFVKLGQAGYNAAIGTTTSAVMAGAEASENFKRLSNAKSGSQDRIKNTTSGFNKGIDFDSHFNNLKNRASQIDLNNVKDKALEYKDKAVSVASENAPGAVEKLRAQMDSFKEQLPANLSKEEIRNKLEEKKQELLAKVSPETREKLDNLKEQGMNIFSSFKDKASSLANKALDATGLDAPPPPPPSRWQKTKNFFTGKKEEPVDNSLSARMGRIQGKLDPKALVNGANVDKGFSSAAKGARGASDFVFKNAEKATNDLPFFQRMAAKAALKTANMANKTAISATAYAGKTVAKHAANQVTRGGGITRKRGHLVKQGPLTRKLVYITKKTTHKHHKVPPRKLTRKL
jgi:hypothetical protein